jgi:hypothetical protein
MSNCFSFISFRRDPREVKKGKRGGSSSKNWFRWRAALDDVYWEISMVDDTTFVEWYYCFMKRN